MKIERLEKNVLKMVQEPRQMPGRAGHGTGRFAHGKISGYFNPFHSNLNPTTPLLYLRAVVQSNSTRFKIE